jgi:hypothetical protein
MKTYLLVFTLLLCVSRTASAQDEPDFKHDIGINTFIVLNGILETSQTPFSLMYKTYNAQNRATRLGVDLSINLYNSKREQTMNAKTDQRQDYATISFVVGREFQRGIAKKWILYYGGDLVPQYSFSSMTREENDQEVNTRESRTYTLNARPFLGIRFNVAPMLYLSVEASAYLGYSYSSTSDNYVNPDFIDTEDRSKSLNLGTNPVTGIYMYYRF